ncbi:UNVERIFIED_ORG: hypothetical protein M2438_000417 [Methylobacterium sp. SuP10 SLI 274]|uniref:hypothetical protein n=1 Tax=Methylorubrum extorquens TaxID=408 RepID=UPI00209F2308|nr:hypothetical protein [Methylorubrum extorquens]MDF9861615.1 hypothetical protein [Methylorubrum pseudosasae]MDH6635242.1 hypothetical protein [Methylobacterium sp. SuP10 SLI 274]MDH6664411.1 hypothetical protein [Methylorubrum zatmanii]MCP1561413.1 hypothetical protein [Methylorubrum extorquens]MDF9789908.1 hypothetical protein [Methylorubrum extorquens]
MQIATLDSSKGIDTPAIGQHPGFKSYKTIRPIPYPSRWHRDLLIQATLDPGVDEIDHIHPTDAGDGSLSLSMTANGSQVRVKAVRDAGGPLRQQPDADEILLTRSFVLAEPRASDARAVWATRNLKVKVGDRLRILVALADGRERRISDLVSCIRDADADPFEAILSLACRGVLAIDLRHGLHPNVCVERSKHMITSRASS